MATLQASKPREMRAKSSQRSLRKKVYEEDTQGFAPRPVWAQRFEEISGQALEKYLAGHRKAADLFTEQHIQSLATLGTSPQELYDFIEDWCEYGVPSFETALRITEVRVEYFLREQGGSPSPKTITANSLPPRDAELGGFVWLPRIIAKGQAKLRGEMAPEIMYGCAGDRAFLREVGIDPVQFLRIVWSAGDDVERIVKYVTTSANFQETLLPRDLKVLQDIA